MCDTFVFSLVEDNLNNSQKTFKSKLVGSVGDYVLLILLCTNFCSQRNEMRLDIKGIVPLKIKNFSSHLLMLYGKETF